MRIIKEILQCNRKVIPVEGLAGASKWFFVEQLWDMYQRPILVLTDKQRLESALGDIRFFLNRLSQKKGASPCAYPCWEVLPFEPLSPHPDIMGERLYVLNRLRKGKNFIIVTTVEAIMQKVMPKNILERHSLKIDRDDFLEREIITDYLITGGYRHADAVGYKGEFSIRGGIIDIFPSSSLRPVRMEFFGDEVESIKEFDISTQRSVKIIDSVDIPPAREFVLPDNLREKGIERIREDAKRKGKDTDAVVECFAQSILFSGMERFAPYFYEMDTLFTYLQDDTIIALDEKELITQAQNNFFAVMDDEYKRALARDDLYPEPEMVYMTEENLSASFDSYRCIELSSLKLSESSQQSFPVEVRPADIFRHLFNKFLDYAKGWLKEGNSVFVVVRTDGQAQRLREILTEKEMGAEIVSKGSSLNMSSTGVLSIVIGELSSGFILPSSHAVFVTEEEIYGPQKKARIRKGRRKENLLAGVDRLQPSDFVVHLEYGIGLYSGTTFIQVHNREEEFLDIEYADGEKLYLPVEGISYLQKYKGIDDIEPRLAKLGSIAWKKTKEKAKKAIEEIAQDLLKLYAVRTGVDGFAFSPDETWHKEFAESFVYDETEDQIRAIEDVIKDMESPKPMDRLVCGDVGFGKTEVAMRAAFKSVIDKKQAAILVPTTLLAHQHCQTFVQRFKQFPIRIEMLSRFKSAKEQREIIKEVREGKVDIIIGTHRLLQKDMTFHDLGLIVIDEEQRFGVSHKEKLKALKHSVDVLSLSATPIPRTLHLSLVGIRDMSIIATPPHDRQAIRTYIRKFSENVIHEAAVREMERNGQIFFVHNRVENIDSMADYIKTLVPGARVGVAHGQMHERQLEKVMLDFIERRLDILVCTTIIESGLDIPAANTIIINRADKFGLAQLYQLRGRVGRDRHRAYAYLLVTDDALMSKAARARLEALEELSDLGAGLQLATRDLEIRGSGNMLGHRQSGNIATVGFYMYCNIMEEAVSVLKGEGKEKLIDPQVKIGIKGSIPKNYISNVNERLEMYKRLFLTDEKDSLYDMADEMLDRYGPLPQDVEDLIAVLSVKLLAKRLKITHIEKRKESLVITFDHNTPVKGEKALALMRQNKGMKFLSSNEIQIRCEEKDSKERIDKIKIFLQELSGVPD